MSTTWRRFTFVALALVVTSFAATASAQSPCAPGSPQLIIYHAGSLTAAFSAVEKLFTQQTGICVTDVSAGSVDAARRVTTGGEPCDIYASADYVDIDVLLKPASFADYTIRFAQGGMILAYTTNSRNAATIAAPGGVFAPPAAVPNAADDWFMQLSQPGVTIGGSHPFLDPSGYRADLIFRLTEDHYRVPNLYNTLLGHYSVNKATDALGKTYDYQFIYEHSALAAFNADATKTYRYVRLPDEVSLSDPKKTRLYGKEDLIIPGLRIPDTAPAVRIPATRVEWGLTILNTARNRGSAIAFLQLLFSPQGVALQTATGPAPISPPVVSRRDDAELPRGLRSLVEVLRKGH